MQQMKEVFQEAPIADVVALGLDILSREINKESRGHIDECHENVHNEVGEKESPTMKF